MEIPLTQASTETEDDADTIFARQQTAAPPASPAPPSASSSPSHDFSFSISLHNCNSSMVALPVDKARAVHDQMQQPAPNSQAIDMTPADDIFFQGHLLPLHLLPHPSRSRSRSRASPPRPSANSLLDRFTTQLPITKTSFEEEEGKRTHTIDESSNFNSEEYCRVDIHDMNSNNNISHTWNMGMGSSRGRKNKSNFSLMGLKRWRSKGLEEAGQKPKRKLIRGSDVSQFVARMVSRPLKYFKGIRMTMISREIDDHDCKSARPLSRRQQPQSLSGNLVCRTSCRDSRGRRSGEFSAPASVRTSPMNSGLLAAKAAGLPPPTSDSTMEELQAAIQAAISHCKNSIAPWPDNK
ncbi:hypothetical protein Dimus_026415 [Dionaea muscipula]